MSKTDATWLTYCYIAFAVVVAFVMNKAIETVGIQMDWVERVEFFQIYNKTFSILLGALAAYLMGKNEERREHHLSVIGEVRRVRWPTADATKQMTLIVAVVVAIFSVILFCFDTVWFEFLKFLT